MSKTPKVLLDWKSNPGCETDGGVHTVVSM